MTSRIFKVDARNTDNEAYECHVYASHDFEIKVDCANRVQGLGNFHTAVSVSFSKRGIIVHERYRTEDAPTTSTITLAADGIKLERKKSDSAWYDKQEPLKQDYKTPQEFRESPDTQSSKTFSIIALALQAIDNMTPEQKSQISETQKQIVRDAKRELAISEVQIA